MEVVLRNEQVEQARAGDKLVFTGNLVVVPDIAMLTIPGERVQVGRRGARPFPRVGVTVRGTLSATRMPFIGLEACPLAPAQTLASSTVDVCGPADTPACLHVCHCSMLRQSCGCISLEKVQA